MARPKQDPVTVVMDWHATAVGQRSMSLRFQGCQLRILQRGATYHAIMCVDGTQKWMSLRAGDQTTAQARAEAILRAMAAPVTPTDEDDVAERPSRPGRDVARADTGPTATARSLAAPMPPGLASAPPARRTVLVGDKEFMVSADGITVSELLHGYRLRPQFAKNKRSTQADAHSRSLILEAGLGANTRVRDMDDDTLTAYEQRRLEGGIPYRVALTSRLGRVLPERDRVTPPTSQRSVEADMVFLKAACDWARAKKTTTGESVLDVDPLDEHEIEEEKNKKRPVATQDRFERMLASARTLAAQETDPAKRCVFEQFELALQVVEGTGRRISAVLGLEWDDLPATSPTAAAEQRITFRLDLDKTGVEATVPLAPHVARVVSEHRKHRGPTVSQFVFPSRDGKAPITRDNLAHTFREVEAHARLTPLDGGQYHPYRRKFASERKHLPQLTVMRLMGLKDMKVFVECYAQVSEEDMRTALTDAVRLHDTSLERSKRGRRRPRRDK